MNRNLFLGLLAFSVFSMYSQQNVNDYKYVIIPEAYLFLNENDQYQLNSLTEFLFEKYGFTAFIRGQELPEELKRNGCMALSADVRKKPGLFLTKLVVELKNCNGSVVFTSSDGQSREKDFKRSYQEALRDAFKDVQKLKYSYNGTSPKPDSKTTLDVVKTKEPMQQAVDTKPQMDKDVTPITQLPVASNKLDDAKAVRVNSIEKRYTFDSKEFLFKKEEYGFELMEIAANNRKSIGKIFSSSRENTYIVRAGDYSGNGYFDAYGNFVLERINPVTNNLIKDIFARQ